MHNRKVPAQDPTPQNSPKTNAQIESLLHEARMLHRAAKSGSVSRSLPALRRLHAAGVCYGVSVSGLYQQRETLQRKHFLRMLAIEAGYSSWEKYKPVLLAPPEHATKTRHFDEKCVSTLNLWFSSEQQAQEYAEQHGGDVLKYGHQAVVLPSPLEGEKS
ncbi:hypothetical protein Q8W40_05960 [Vibrio penaeicida]|uniref:hypothetical protein n=1 Tax=Vibrio penaeicida TaxID=104609 RepID=UPI002733B536|nr:hypothetical protein [Vibrio penaeicida]MDP2571716.1 hypothetical protein [Vibrio penaeicida]